MLCVDEKSQVQALDRTQSILPMRPGTPERHTHDYVRHGVTSLFAALNDASGAVIHETHRRHRTTEFKKFWIAIDQHCARKARRASGARQSVVAQDAHHPSLGAASPPFHLHFTPTSSSWLNLVERWFAELTNRWLRRGTHRSVGALEASLKESAETWNENPRSYVWHPTADEMRETPAAHCERI